MAQRALRVLLAHCYYRSPPRSGEDIVFDNERRLLEECGVAVIPFLRRNEDLDDRNLRGRVRIALETTWSRNVRRDLVELIKREQPDLAHIHNTFAQISPSAYAACRSLGVPVVQTVHNYRLVCVNGLLLRDGHLCEDCVGGHSILGLWPGLRHRCYRDSVAATGALTLMLAVNRARGSYLDVDRYVALTEFAASRLVAGGLPADRFVVKPNFLPDPPPPGAGRGGYAVYIGRLSHEKGLLTLVRAWRDLGHVPLKIVGTGHLAEELQRIASEQGLPIEFLGFRPRSEVMQIVSNAAVQVVPSECYEGFPMVILEAFACGTPVIAARIGSLDEIVVEGTSGAKFQPGDAGDLALAVQRLLADSERLATMRRTVREIFDRDYTADRNIRQLRAIYQNALSNRQPSVKIDDRWMLVHRTDVGSRPRLQTVLASGTLCGSDFPGKIPPSQRSRIASRISASSTHRLLLRVRIHERRVAELVDEPRDAAARGIREPHGLRGEEFLRAPRHLEPVLHVGHGLAHVEPADVVVGTDALRELRAAAACA